jgi:hypothetical protein
LGWGRVADNPTGTRKQASQPHLNERFARYATVDIGAQRFQLPKAVTAAFIRKFFSTKMALESIRRREKHL